MEGHACTEELHIHLTPKDQCFDQAVELILPDGCVSTIKSMHMEPHPSLSV